MWSWASLAFPWVLGFPIGVMLIIMAPFWVLWGLQRMCTEPQWWWCSGYYWASAERWLGEHRQYPSCLGLFPALTLPGSATWDKALCPHRPRCHHPLMVTLTSQTGQGLKEWNRVKCLGHQWAHNKCSINVCCVRVKLCDLRQVRASLGPKYKRGLGWGPVAFNLGCSLQSLGKLSKKKKINKAGPRISLKMPV